ncbi:MAG TPA: hypothetical protein EYP77_06575 [Anaerolineae bacterium]|nr:hypothetical protein [Anaerolineae bacterium]
MDPITSLALDLAGGDVPVGAGRLFGLMDLAGNVWEWAASLWKPDSWSRVVRGGSWYNGRERARCAVRDRGCPGNSYGNFGFRCVSPVSGFDS